MKTKILQSIASSLIGIILILAGVLALSVGIRNYRAVVKLDDITVNSGTVVYLISVYSMDYEGENLEEDFKNYISDLVADAYLYSLHSGYTVEDKLLVDETTSSVLEESADGSVGEFNRVAKEHGYGFTYSDFKNATALKYKADRAKEVLPGLLGEAEYATAKAEALELVEFRDGYYEIDLSAVPHEYYVK